jgi:SAM-dependent methyltransferase
MARFLEAVHGASPRTLREDFCGSGAVCRAWARLIPRGRAVGVDLDAEPLARLKGVPGVRAVRRDVMASDLRADIISATNFPVGYWHTRKDLVRYLKATRARLNPGGVFVCDTYGGESAFHTGSIARDFFTGDGLRVRYTWEQRSADPLTGMVTDAIHFRADRDGDVEFALADAFVYRWRLWSVPELRDAMAEAGFASSEVYSELVGAVDGEGRTHVRPVADASELDDSFIVCIAARVSVGRRRVTPKRPAPRAAAARALRASSGNRAPRPAGRRVSRG